MAAKTTAKSTARTRKPAAAKQRRTAQAKRTAGSAASKTNTPTTAAWDEEESLRYANSPTSVLTAESFDELQTFISRETKAPKAFLALLNGKSTGNPEW